MRNFENYKSKFSEIYEIQLSENSGHSRNFGCLRLLNQYLDEDLAGTLKNFEVFKNLIEGITGFSDFEKLSSGIKVLINLKKFERFWKPEISKNWDLDIGKFLENFPRLQYTAQNMEIFSKIALDYCNYTIHLQENLQYILGDSKMTSAALATIPKSLKNFIKETFEVEQSVETQRIREFEGFHNLEAIFGEKEKLEKAILGFLKIEKQKLNQYFTVAWVVFWILFAISETIYNIKYKYELFFLKSPNHPDKQKERNGSAKHAEEKKAWLKNEKNKKNKRNKKDKFFYFFSSGS
ncbi:Protein CBG18812 [Caenorhabditis briggsae]|uniref:Protein CBG18812 n=1 Tax=Caenorhabditis briggsae TaxID=6238 RepID=A8XU60_CAEBR|nr:Protein CBG18812 [Caenorhabditis briggsae]CAP36185.1 Protein CBG18812 [Caenorhabditis briggsae]